MPRANDEISVIVKTYDFTLWLLPHLTKFSRDHRFTLGNRLEEDALEVLELLVEASYASEKRPLLQRANTRLNRIRYLVRLTKNLRQISLKTNRYMITGEPIFLLVGRDSHCWNWAGARPIKHFSGYMIGRAPAQFQTVTTSST